MTEDVLRKASLQPHRQALVRRAFVLRADGIGGRVAKGAKFQFVGIVVRTVLTIGSTAILARLLTPADFGYIAMASVVTELASLLGAFGFTSVLIQRRVINRLQLDTVFWSTLGIGMLLATAVFGISFVADRLFGDPVVGPLLRVMCLNFVLGSLNAVSWVVLSRLMRFHTEFWVAMIGLVVRTLVALSLAWGGMGVWSLAWGGVAGSVAVAALSFAAVPYRPRLRFHLPLLTSTWRTSGGYFANSALYYANMNLDLLLIGRRLGAVPLGYYQNARSLTDEIRARIAMPIQHVLFPAFSALNDDRERFQQLALRVGRMLAAVVVPVGVGVSANANELVLTLYGEQWRDMVPVMSMFGLSAALRASTAIASPLFNATDRVMLAMRYNAVSTLLIVAAIVLALPFGIDAVAQAVALSSLYALVVLRRALRLIGLGWRGLLDVLGRPFLAAAAMWLATLAMHEFKVTDLVPWRALLVQVAVGASVYLLVLHALSRRYFTDFRDAARAMLASS